MESVVGAGLVGEAGMRARRCAMRSSTRIAGTTPQGGPGSAVGAGVGVAGSGAGLRAVGVRAVMVEAVVPDARGTVARGGKGSMAERWSARTSVSGTTGECGMLRAGEGSWKCTVLLGRAGLAGMLRGDAMLLLLGDAAHDGVGGVEG